MRHFLKLVSVAFLIVFIFENSFMITLSYRILNTTDTMLSERSLNVLQNINKIK